MPVSTRIQGAEYARPGRRIDPAVRSLSPSTRRAISGERPPERGSRPLLKQRPCPGEERDGRSSPSSLVAADTKEAGTEQAPPHDVAYAERSILASPPAASQGRSSTARDALSRRPDRTSRYPLQTPISKMSRVFWADGSVVGGDSPRFETQKRRHSWSGWLSPATSTTDIRGTRSSSRRFHPSRLQLDLKPFQHPQDYHHPRAPASARQSRDHSHWRTCHAAGDESTTPQASMTARPGGIVQVHGYVHGTYDRNPMAEGKYGHTTRPERAASAASNASSLGGFLLSPIKALRSLFGPAEAATGSTAGAVRRPVATVTAPGYLTDEDSSVVGPYEPSATTSMIPSTSRERAARGSHSTTPHSSSRSHSRQRNSAGVDSSSNGQSDSERTIASVRQPPALSSGPPSRAGAAVGGGYGADMTTLASEALQSSFLTAVSPRVQRSRQRRPLAAKLPSERLTSAAVRRDRRPPWVPDSAVTRCMWTGCVNVFRFGMRRRHHCRACGKLFCSEHSSDFIALPYFGYTKPQRVCPTCHLTWAYETDEDATNSVYQLPCQALTDVLESPDLKPRDIQSQGSSGGSTQSPLAPISTLPAAARPSSSDSTGPNVVATIQRSPSGPLAVTEDTFPSEAHSGTFTRHGRERSVSQVLLSPSQNMDRVVHELTGEPRQFMVRPILGPTMPQQDPLAAQDTEQGDSSTSGNFVDITSSSAPQSRNPTPLIEHRTVLYRVVATKPPSRASPRDSNPFGTPGASREGASGREGSSGVPSRLQGATEQRDGRPAAVGSVSRLRIRRHRTLTDSDVDSSAENPELRVTQQRRQGRIVTPSPQRATPASVSDGQRDSRGTAISRNTVSVTSHDRIGQPSDTPSRTTSVVSGATSATGPGGSNSCFEEVGGYAKRGSAYSPTPLTSMAPSHAMGRLTRFSNVLSLQLDPPTSAADHTTHPLSHQQSQQSVPCRPAASRPSSASSSLPSPNGGGSTSSARWVENTTPNELRNDILSAAEGGRSPNGQRIGRDGMPVPSLSNSLSFHRHHRSLSGSIYGTGAAGGQPQHRITYHPGQLGRKMRRASGSERKLQTRGLLSGVYDQGFTGGSSNSLSLTHDHLRQTHFPNSAAKHTAAASKRSSSGSYAHASGDSRDIQDSKAEEPVGSQRVASAASPPVVVARVAQTQPHLLRHRRQRASSFTVARPSGGHSHLSSLQRARSDYPAPASTCSEEVQDSARQGTRPNGSHSGSGSGSGGSGTPVDRRVTQTASAGPSPPSRANRSLMSTVWGSERSYISEDVTSSRASSDDAMFKLDDGSLQGSPAEYSPRIGGARGGVWMHAASGYVPSQLSPMYAAFAGPGGAADRTFARGMDTHMSHIQLPTSAIPTENSSAADRAPSPTE